MFASSIAMIGFLPPSSSPTLIIFFAALSYTCLPVSTPPVKEIARMSGWATRPSPTTAPLPVSMFTTPGGKPASSSTSTNLAAQRGGRLLPLVEGFFRMAARLIELVLRGQRNCRQGLAGRRVARLEALPVRFPPLAADEEAVFLDHVLAERSKVRPGYDVIVGSAMDLRAASTTGSSEYRTMARAASRRPSATTSGDNGRTAAANRFRHAFGPTHAVRHPNARPVSTSEGLSPTIHAPRGRTPRSRAAARSIPGRGFRHAQSDKTLCGQ